MSFPRPLILLESTLAASFGVRCQQITAMRRVSQVEAETKSTSWAFRAALPLRLIGAGEGDDPRGPKNRLAQKPSTGGQIGKDKACADFGTSRP
ncbi:MAG: hypothetical protein ACOZQL_31030 [Myxococcota bacterium]